MPVQKNFQSKKSPAKKVVQKGIKKNVEPRTYSEI